MTASPAARRALGVVGLVGIACIAFLPGVWSSFVSDDFLLLHNLHHGGVGWVFTHNDLAEAGAAGHFYRPVWLLWNIWLFKAFGASTTALHVASLLLYALIAAEVWALASTFVDGTRAWVAAAAFAAYPRHGESVVWFSGNTDLVAVALALAALLVVRSRASLALRITGAALLTAGATLSKEIAFVLPILALLVLPWRRGRRELVIPGAMLLVEVGVFIARYSVIGGIGGYSQYPWTPREAVGSFGSYVLASAIPPSVPAFRYPVVFALPLAVLALAVWRAVVLWRRGNVDDVRVAGIGAAWFVVALLPLLSLPVDLNNANGERNLMLASVGLALALAALIHVPPRLLPVAAAAAAVVVLAGVSFSDSFDWVEAGKLSDRLVPRAVALTPRNGELLLLSVPEGYRTAHVFIGGDISHYHYPGSDHLAIAFCAPVELRSLSSGTVRFQRDGTAFQGTTSWAAPFDFPVLHSAAGLTGECSYSRLPGGPERPGLGLRVLVAPTASRKPVAFAYFDGHDLRRCC